MKKVRRLGDHLYKAQGEWNTLHAANLNLLKELSAALSKVLFCDFIIFKCSIPPEAPAHSKLPAIAANMSGVLGHGSTKSGNPTENLIHPTPRLDALRLNPCPFLQNQPHTVDVMAVMDIEIPIKGSPNFLSAGS